jgi:hypothetical protein
MEILFISILAISIIAFIYILYLKKRINNVAEFLFALNTKCYKWDVAHPGERSSYEWFYDEYVQSFDVYWYSFKPLKEENWFPKNVLAELNS